MTADDEAAIWPALDRVVADWATFRRKTFAFFMRELDCARSFAELMPLVKKLADGEHG